MEAVRTVVLSAAVAAVIGLFFGQRGTPAEEPIPVEDWTMFSSEGRSLYIYDTRNGTLLRVYGDGSPSFPNGYMEEVPYAYRDDGGYLVRGSLTDRILLKFGREHLSDVGKSGKRPGTDNPAPAESR